MESVRRIAVFRALYLGDLLCAVPFFRALRRAWPAAEVTLIGLPWARAFVRRCSYLDRFMAFPGFPGLWPRPVRPDRVLAGLRALQARRFDLVVNLHGGGLVSTIFCVLLGGRRTVGLYQQPEAPDLYGLDLAVPYHTDRHEVQRLLAVATAMGCPPAGDHLEFAVLPVDRLRLRRRLRRWGLLAQPFVVLHPGAREASRRWPADRFAQVGAALAARGYRIVLTGTAEERPVTAAVQAALGGQALDLAGQLGLGDLAALLARSALVVSNDTGPAHLAVALDRPVVVVFGAADPRRWAPRETRRTRVLSAPVSCRPCGRAECPYGHYACLTGTTPAAVLRAALDLLAASRRLRADLPDV